MPCFLEQVSLRPPLGVPRAALVNFLLVWDLYSPNEIPNIMSLLCVAASVEVVRAQVSVGSFLPVSSAAGRKGKVEELLGPGSGKLRNAVVIQC